MTVVDPPDLKLWPTLRHLFPLWWAQRRLVAIGLTCALVFTGLSLTIPILIQRTIDDAIDGGDHSLLLPYLGTITLIAAVRFGVNFTRRYATARVGIAVEARLRGMMYDAYLRFPRAFYDRHATGEVISRATNDIYPVRYFIGWGVVQAIQSMMMLVGAAIVLISVNARLTLFAALSMPPIAVLTYVFAHKVFPISRIVQAKKGHLTEATDEAVVGIEMVQAFGREDDVRERFTGRAEAVRHETMRQAGVEARFLPGLIFLPSLGIAAVLWFGGRDAIEGNLTIGQFTLFITLLLQLVWPLEALGWIINLGPARDGRGLALVRLARLDRAAPGTRAAADAPRRPALRSGSRTSTSATASARKCSLASTSTSIPARSSQSAERPGRGRPRSSTCCRGSTTPPPGACCSAASTAASWGSQDLRRSVALVTQKPVLFSIPLRDNLLAARPDADWVEVLAACEAAGVAAFVDGLPDGYDTLIGERGVNLSGGQRQRVALARALVAGARVIVLDDPMSAVDTETERLLVTTLRPAVAGRTVLIAGQRLSTILVADRAVVLREGRIVENGLPHDLIRRGGAFTELFGDEALAA